LTPQTRGAIFLVFDANRPSFTVYFFPRDGNENERIGTNSARKTKKKKKPIDELSERDENDAKRTRKRVLHKPRRVLRARRRRKCLDGILLRIIRVSPRGSTTSSPWTP
jgi:hypothetical protein